MTDNLHAHQHRTVNQDAGPTEADAKRELAARLHEDHGATVNGYPRLRYAFGVRYRNMDELPMRQFRSEIKRIARICEDVERES